jgi:hypothetical protein
VTVPGPACGPGLPVLADDCCSPGSQCTACCPAAEPRGAGWQRAARQARWLAWASLAWMCTEGAVGLWQGLAAGSAALTGWALGSAVEGLASVIVIWRFTGTRALSEIAELRAPCSGARSGWDLAAGHHATATAAGIALTAVALAVMPLLGRAKHRLAARLGSTATAGEGIQNYLCAAQAAAVLASLAVTAAWPGGWWTDPVTGLVIAAAAVWEGIQSWSGDDCC